MDPVDRAPVLLAGPPPCGYALLWWDGDGEGAYVCTLPAGHLTLHTDGKVTFDADETIDCLCATVRWACRLHPPTLLEVPDGPY